MLTVSYSEARRNFKDICDKVIDGSETIVISREDNKNVVVISENEYNNIQENLFIMGNKPYYDELIKSKEQFEKGFFKKRDLIEVQEK